jgi:putative oxidoreductase
MNNRHLQFVFRIILGGVFIWAGILKIFNPLGFAQDIANYRVFPQAVSFFLALFLPWIEVFCGALVILGVLRRSSSLLLSGLLVSFLVLIVTTLIRGIDVECGCFGSLSRTVDYKLLLTDLGLLFLALSIFFYNRDMRGKDIKAV